jgi:hypothetical protein
MSDKAIWVPLNSVLQLIYITQELNIEFDVDTTEWFLKKN